MASLLVVGSGILGAVTLRDFALALFVGLLVGAYSSIFVATPILAWLKEREPRYAALRERSTRAAVAARSWRRRRRRLRVGAGRAPSPTRCAAVEPPDRRAAGAGAVGTDGVATAADPRRRPSPGPISAALRRSSDVASVVRQRGATSARLQWWGR